MSPLFYVATLMMSVAVIGGGVSGHLLGKHNEAGPCRVVLFAALVLGWLALFTAAKA